MTSLLIRTRHDTLDAHRIYEGLWQGSKPDQGSVLRDAGFEVLVLCARQHQPRAKCFAGVEVIYAPNDDDSSREPTPKELRIAIAAARQVADAMRSGKQVLVTCWQGWNRSGLVSALALHYLLGISGNEAISLVQFGRPMALSNARFQTCLTRLPARAK